MHLLCCFYVSISVISSVTMSYTYIIVCQPDRKRLTSPIILTVTLVVSVASYHLQAVCGICTVVQIDVAWSIWLECAGACFVEWSWLWFIWIGKHLLYTQVITLGHNHSPKPLFSMWYMSWFMTAQNLSAGSGEQTLQQLQCLLPNHGGIFGGMPQRYVCFALSLISRHRWNVY